MASIRERSRSDGTTAFVVLWRHEKQQKAATFNDKKTADGFKDDLDRFGHDEAIRIQSVAVTLPISLTEWLTAHVDTLSGVEKATPDKYRTYIKRDIAPTIGHMPLNAITEATVARWINELAAQGNAPKTIANKHALLASGLKSAVRAGKITSNPCDYSRLPRRDSEEMVFLEVAEFEQILSFMTDRWKPLARFLVLTGARFGEATALTVGDVDRKHMTCRIAKAWKYASKGEDQYVSYPKTRKSTRTINLPPEALEGVDLNRPAGELLFATQAGDRIRNQLFRNKAWSLAVKRAKASGLQKQPRIHDLRHTCASWLLNAGTPIQVVQAQLGHESIQTTVDRYGHIDRRQGLMVAATLSSVFTSNRPQLLT
jgi:integrase